MKGLRKLKIESFIKKEIETEIEKMDDPNLRFLTITRVEISKDLRLAKVFVGLLNEDKLLVDNLMDTLAKASKRLQKIIAQKIKSRYTPLISFHCDIGFLKGTRVLEILDRIKKEEEQSDENIS